MNATAEPQRRVSAAAWSLLAIAIFCEIGGAIALRFSEAFTNLSFTLAALGAFATALYLVSHVMKELPVSIAYPIWAGGGTAGVALIGLWGLNEPFTLLKAVGIALVMVGVVLVNAVSEKRSGC